MNKIKKLRNERHLSQAELAERVGVSRSCISHYETGRHCPLVKDLPNLAQALGCSVEELLQEDPVDGQIDQEDPERVCGECKYIVDAERIPSDCALGYGETWSGHVGCAAFEKR